MSRKKYTKEFLISELQRFVLENGRNPRALDMKTSENYPPKNIFINYFGTWNNALVEAGLIINKRQEYLTGFEICYTCGRHSKYWNTDDFGFRMCRKCYNKKDAQFRHSKLDKSSAVGKGLFAEHLVFNVLKENGAIHYNVDNANLHHPIDIKDNIYNNIDVKAAKLIIENNKNGSWKFILRKRKICDTYICLAFNSDWSIIKHVWIIPNEGKYRNLSTLSISNVYNSLLKYKQYEIDNKDYNNMFNKINSTNIAYFKED